LQASYAKHLFLTANIREDDNDSFGQHMTYRIAPSVILPFTDTTIKASYGTGFKAPTLSQLFQKQHHGPDQLQQHVHFEYQHRQRHHRRHRNLRHSQHHRSR
jgi:outer membrane cobalamin receptor